MNNFSKSSKNSITIQILIAVVLIASFVPVALAGHTKEYNPYTVLGLQMRAQLTPDTPGAEGVDLGPLVFQEIVPCRFVSTLEEDDYEAPWGPEAFQMHEARTYFPKGVLVAGNGWENPCSKHVPVESLAVALRLMSHGPIESGSVYISPANSASAAKPALVFTGGSHEMKETTVVLKDDGFTMAVDHPTHMTIDIIGYFLRDEVGYGLRGEKGDRGEQGLQGERGAEGAQGAQGAQGEKGERGADGAQGAQGLQGEKGEKGDRGEQGLQGERGETGAQGAQGEKGEKGDRGETGAQGAQGEKGEKGDRGETGAQGAQGEKGEKGDRGETGAQGAQGARGNDGAQGPQGPAGPMGPQGPKGEDGKDGKAGILVSSGGPLVFPPPGQIRIDDPAITAYSIIIVQYDEYSNGNAIGVASQGKGWFVASGSPNKPFKYIVLTPQ